MKRIQDIINSDYRDYSHYVVENRAIPSMVDGLKPSQRKALYAATKTARKPIKTIGLVGETIKAGYHHGDQSLTGAINLMAADWANNLPLLDGIGAFGSRLTNEAAAARYTSVSLSKNFDKYFADEEILEEHPDPENREPLYYLPLIPWVLVNGVRGIAVGFATEIQPRNPKELLEACQSIAKGENKKFKLTPYYHDFKGTITPESVNTWLMTGVVKQTSTNTWMIEEIPYGVERSSYVDILDNLEDEGKIQSYKDLCDKSGFRFEIRFKRGVRKSEDEVIKLLKLRRRLNENLTVIGPDGKVKVYESAQDLLGDFVAFRLVKVRGRIDHQLKTAQESLQALTAKLTFIKKVVDGKLSFQGKTKDWIRNWLKAEFPDFEDRDSFLNIPTYAFCDDEVRKLEKKIQEVKDRIAYLEQTNEVTEYIKDLDRVA